MVSANSAAIDDAGDGSHSRWKTRYRLRLATVVFALIVIGIFFALTQTGVLRPLDWWASLGPWWVNDGWPWVSKWLVSPGFGGAAAVAAASLAFVGTRHQARLNAWWQRVEWALNLYIKPEATREEREAGIAALLALQNSKLAKKDERTFLGEVVTATTLDLNGDGDETDDLIERSGQDSRPADVENFEEKRRRTGLWTKLSEMLDTRRKR